MSLETTLDNYYKIINVPNSELDGMIGRCEGHYGYDQSFSIIRLTSQLSTGQRSVVMINSCLEAVKRPVPNTVDFVKKKDRWC